MLDELAYHNLDWMPELEGIFVYSKCDGTRLNWIWLGCVEKIGLGFGKIEWEKGGEAYEKCLQKIF